MELWFTENHTENVRFSMRIEKHIFSAQSEFQKIDIFETTEFGRILALDGLVMLTEKDEANYHEMITHVAMATKPDIKRVLVIGAGDGGTVRELTKYSGIEHIDMVEIDELVVYACREHLQQTACALGDPRVHIHYADGLRFVRRKKDEYDLIIVDSTDPFGPGEGLFTKEFYGNCYNALNDAGILVNQHESPFYNQDAESMARAHLRIKQFFPVCRVYQFHIPTYPSGHWLFGFASKSADPVRDLDADAWNALDIVTNYYNTDIHVGAFALPSYVRERLNEGK